jgi:hypothetical protein
MSRNIIHEWRHSEPSATKEYHPRGFVGKLLYRSFVPSENFGHDGVSGNFLTAYPPN